MRKIRCTAWALSATAGCTLSFSAFAQGAPVDAATSMNSGEEIVVTANKRRERLFEVPSSVTAVQADVLPLVGATRMEDYLSNVPGISLTNVTAGGGQNNITIRGIDAGGGNPTVAVFIDDLPFSPSVNTDSIPDLDPADLERVEVLRGPQGTLYGGGAMGGLLKYVTKSPEFDQFAIRGQLDATSVDGGDTGFGLRVAANIPVTDILAIRASAVKRNDPGFVDNVFTGETNYNETKVKGGRLSVAIRPIETFTARLSVLHQDIKVLGNANVDESLATGEPLYSDLETSRAPGSDGSHSKYTFIDLNIEGDLGWATLNSSSAYLRKRFVSAFDYSGILGPVVNIIFGVPDAGVAIETTNRLDKLSQELRLSRIDGISLDWQIGGFYTSEDALNFQIPQVFDIMTGGPTDPVLPQIGYLSQRTTFKEIAAFGNITYNFTPQFDVTIGGRYSHNKQTSFQDNYGPIVGPRAPISTRSSDSSFTFLVNPRYRFNDALMAYARLASGYRAGGSNVISAGVPPTFGPDRVTNYEIGLKGALWQNILNFDLAAFYIDWKKIQLSGVSGLGITYYDNGGKAHSQGIEGSFTFSPVTGLSISGNMAYTEAEIDIDLSAPLVGSKGDWLPNSSRWASKLAATYQFELGQDLSASFGGSYSYTGKRYSAFQENRSILPSYDVVNAHASLEYNGLTFTVFAKNIGDSRGRLGAYRLGPVEQIAVIQPRTFGLSIAAEY